MEQADNNAAIPANPAFRRRAPRVGFELPVRCAFGQSRSTVMLKDMTRFGARIDGMDQPRIGEAITLLLPGAPARMAFVVWHDGGTSGLEFGDPLCPQVFDDLVRDFAIMRDAPVDPSTVVPAPDMRPAARAA